MRQLVRRSRRAGWPIEGTLWRCPGQARRRACRVPLAVARGAAPLQPRKRRAQHQHAAHQAAECCTGVQRTLRRCGVASPPCPRSRRAAARPSTSCRSCALPKGSTGCSRSLRSFVQRSARATPHKADPQPGQEAVCGRPGSAYAPPPRPCPPPGRARSGDTTISGIVRKKERKHTTQGRDGRTARRHHTGILRRGVWCASRRPPWGVCLFVSLFAVSRRFSLQPSCHLAAVPLSSFSPLSLPPLSLCA